MKIREGLLGFIPPRADEKRRILIAAGDDPEFNALSPGDRSTVLFVLSHDKNPEAAEAARRSFNKLTPDDLVSALQGRLDPLVIGKIVELGDGNEVVQTTAALNPATDLSTIKKLASTGGEDVVRILMEDIERLVKYPSIIDALKENPVVPKAALDNLRESIASGAISTPSEKKVKEEEEEEEEKSLYKRVQKMNVADKMKLAFAGGKEARDLLIKDSNKIVSMAVLKNPRITEDEIIKLASNRSVSEDILRVIARNKEWVKSYSVKFSMVTNAKTPLNISLRYLETMNERDLQKVAKSKNISNVLSTAAKKKLDLKKKR